MLAASAHAQGPVLYMSPTSTTRPPTCHTQPRSRPSRRSSRSRSNTPSPISHGITDHPANGHNSSAADPTARPAAPRRVRVSRCQVKDGRGGVAGGGGAAPAGGAAGTAGGDDAVRVTGSHGGGSGRGSIVRGGYRRRVSTWWKL